MYINKSIIQYSSKKQFLRTVIKCSKDDRNHYSECLLKSDNFLEKNDNALIILLVNDTQPNSFNNAGFQSMRTGIATCNPYHGETDPSNCTSWDSRRCLRYLSMHVAHGIYRNVNLSMIDSVNLNEWSLFMVCTNKHGMVNCLYRRVTCYHFKIILFFFLRLKVVFILANNAYPDEMPPYAAFYLGLHCSFKSFYGLPHFKGL